MHFACRHIKSDGARCRAAAMRGSNFCYYHTKNRSTARLRADDDFVIPISEDQASIRTSIAQTLNALLSKRIDAKTAGLVLYGLQLAAQAIPRGFPLPSDSVREVTQSSEGDELAPAACLNAVSDCSGCALADTCKNCKIGSSKDKEKDNDQKTRSSTRKVDSWGFPIDSNRLSKLLDS